MDEFALISAYFKECGHSPYDVEQDIGDDAAVVKAPLGHSLVMTMDTLIEGVHFPKNTPPQAIAHKALAVNVSDLAAMGAEPAWFLLSISLPESNAVWLKEFAQSLRQSAEKYAIKLIGGDTCRGALSITIQATGIQQKRSILRSTAKVGDAIYVSGELGKAALGLQNILYDVELPAEIKQNCVNALNYPDARLDVSKLVREYASAMIDISDGLLADLSHILKASQVGAQLNLDDIPMQYFIRQQELYHYALAGGDDYELCFTVAKQQEQTMLNKLKDTSIQVFKIGQITSNNLQVLTSSGTTLPLDSIKGFNHFG